MPYITTSGRKGREEMKLAIERARAEARKVFEAEEAARRITSAAPVAADSVGPLQVRKKPVDRALRTA